MSNLEQNAAIANESREEINSDLAVGMVEAGLHVFIEKTDELLTYDMVFNSNEPIDFESRTFTAPMMEVAQFGALESLCESFDSFNDDVREDTGMSLEDYADELYMDSDESQYKWRDGLSEWQNIRASILSGKTNYLHVFLDNISAEYPSRTHDLLEDLNHYETTYSKRPERMMNNQALYSVEQGDELRYYRAPNGYTADDILKATNSSTPFLKLMDMGKQISGAKYAEIEQSDKCAVSVTINLDTGKARIYEINGGNGGIAENYRNDNNVRFTDVKISEYARNTVEHIPLQRDISHKTTNADLTAQRGESRGKVMEQNTKFEVSTMSKLEGSGAKAIATLVVNSEFAVHGVTVREKKDGSGLFVSMPSERQSNGEYKDVVFPVTKEARAAINNAVLSAYEQLAASPEQTLKNNIAAPEMVSTKVYAQMHEVNSDKTQTKAAGQITLDGCLVVTGVKLNEGTNAEGQTKTFVAMPSKMNSNGIYDDIAHPITADFHNAVDKSVIASVNNIGRYEYKGVKYEELGENPAQSARLDPNFADKLMAGLDKAKIPYHAKCAERTTITVAAADKQSFDVIKKALTDKLNSKDKPQQEHTQKTTHSKLK